MSPWRLLPNCEIAVMNGGKYLQAHGKWSETLREFRGTKYDGVDDVKVGFGL